MHTRPRSCWTFSSSIPERCIPVQGPAGQFLQRYQHNAYWSNVLLASFFNGTRTMLARPISCCLVSSTVSGRCLTVQAASLHSMFSLQPFFPHPFLLLLGRRPLSRPQQPRPPEAPAGIESCGVGRVPSPRTAAGCRIEIHTVTPRLGTIFPDMPARFFAHPSWSTMVSSLGGGGGLPCPGLHLMIVQLVILLWRSFNHVKIFNWNVNKSASRLYDY
jgi:hypothetical protein